MDRRTIKQPYIPYEEIDNGFEAFIEGGENIINFGKNNGFTKEVFRSIIEERYKNGQILRICQTCKNTCKQVKVKGCSFKCFQKEYKYKKRKGRKIK